MNGVVLLTYVKHHRDEFDNRTDLLNHAFLYTAAAGDVTQAAKLASRIVQTSPDDRPARLALAVEAMKHGDFAAARMQIAQSGKGPFTELTLSLLDAWAAEGLGDTPTAIKDSVGQRVIRFSTSSGETAGLDALPGAVSVSVHGDRIELRCSDSDTALPALIATHPDAHDIEVAGIALEDAFITITDGLAA